MTTHRQNVAALLDIAKNLNPKIETFESRGSDRLDFAEVGVVMLGEALQRAFALGFAAAQDLAEKKSNRGVNALAKKWAAAFREEMVVNPNRGQALKSVARRFEVSVVAVRTAVESEEGR